MSIPTHVYMLEMSDGILKVGMTGEPSRRLSNLRTAAHKRGARVTNAVFWETNDPWKVEEYLILAARMECLPAWGNEYFWGTFAKTPAILARLMQFEVTVSPERLDYAPEPESVISQRIAQIMSGLIPT